MKNLTQLLFEIHSGAYSELSECLVKGVTTEVAILFYLNDMQS